MNPDIDDIKIRMYSDLGLETVLQINMHGQYRSLAYVLHRAEKTVETKENIGQVRNDFLVKITPVLMKDSKGYRFKISISRMNTVISMLQEVQKNNDGKSFEIDIKGKEESKYQSFKMDDSEYQIGISLR